MSDYLKQWSSVTPGYLIFLIDQSNSMSHKWFENTSRAEYTAEIVNKTINELIASNAAGENVKNRVFISLIGYGGDDSVINLRSDYLSEYADKPIRTEKFIKKIKQGDNGFFDMNVEMPIFLEPKAEGFTPMGGAFDLAKRLIQGWIEKKQNHPVPVIINISDGHPEGSDVSKTEAETRKTIMFANEIMKLKMDDGFPLIFNVHISNTGTGSEIQFPENEYELNGDSMAGLLYKISTKVPDTYKKAAKDQNLKRIGENSRGFISNASPETLIRFINFGSSAASRTIL